ncbi:MAG: hypothetical protein KY464_03755 [Gemmatimonadetes bacterium]|nr:hypothetical protein [Gemmatimonadota bacterium]
MIENASSGHANERAPFMDTLLRDALPEIKLALGELIDRENLRALPGKYAKLLPESLLVVTLRPDAAEALAPLAQTVERDLTDSVMRHGSLYDRAYRVQLRRSEDGDSPLYQVSAHAGSAPPEDVPAPHEPLPASRPTYDRADAATEAAPLPVADPDATRIADVGVPGWQAGRWVLVVEDLNGKEREVFRLTDSYATVGRRSDDPQLRTTVALSDVPHVSRRQLALVWEERDGAPGFKVYNLGLNPLHLPGQEVRGAHVGKGQLNLDSLPQDATGWLPPGVPLRIGDQGPVLRIDEVPPDEEGEGAEVEVDPDATRHE